MLVLTAIAFVRALSMPVGFTVDPEGTVPMIALTANGTVGAIAGSTDGTYRTRAFRWGNDGSPEIFRALDVVTQPGAQQNGGEDSNAIAAGIAGAGNDLLVTASGAGSFQVMGDAPEEYAPYAYVAWFQLSQLRARRCPRWRVGTANTSANSARETHSQSTAPDWPSAQTRCRHEPAACP